MMRNRSRIAVWFMAAFLFLSVRAFASQDACALPSDGSDLVEIGRFTRQWTVIDLYRVTLRSLRLPLLARKIEESGFNSGTDDARTIDAFAAFLASPGRNCPVALRIEVLIDAKDYERERAGYMATLERAGFPVDELYICAKRPEHQVDINAFMLAILGASAKDTQGIMARRKKGDRIEFFLDQYGDAWLGYCPVAAGQPGFRIKFVSPDVIRGVILTYISRARCSAELRDHLPLALMKNLVDACEIRRRRR